MNRSARWTQSTRLPSSRAAKASRLRFIQPTSVERVLVKVPASSALRMSSSSAMRHPYPDTGSHVNESHRDTDRDNRDD